MPPLRASARLCQKRGLVEGDAGISSKNARKCDDLCAGSGETRVLEVLDLSTHDDVRCPVCTGLLLPPIRACSNGHSTCNTCLDIFDHSSDLMGKAATCPLCRTYMTIVPWRHSKTLLASAGMHGLRRNKAIEEKYANFSFRCDHDGCGKNFPFNVLGAQHAVDGCVYNRYKCDNSGCDTVTRLQDVVKHNASCRMRKITCLHPHEIIGPFTTQAENFMAHMISSHDAEVKPNPNPTISPTTLTTDCFGQLL